MVKHSRLIDVNGLLVIVAAPSGAGKTTLVRHLLTLFPQLEFSVSACNRQQRVGEVHGKDYYFMSTEEFLERVRGEEFVEYEEVYPHNYYGTLKSELQRIWRHGRVVLFDVDVHGGLELKVKFAEKALSVFIKPPSLNALEQRLRHRNTEPEQKIKMRLEKAAYEMEYEKRFDKVVLNDSLEHGKESIVKVVGDFLEKNKASIQFA